MQSKRKLVLERVALGSGAREKAAIQQVLGVLRGA